MSRIGLIAALLVCIVGSLHAADVDPLLDRDQVCSGPASTPICAVKTWLSCYTVRSKDCALVGVKRAAPALHEDIFNTKGPFLKGRPSEDPWTLSWDRIGPFMYKGKVAVHYARKVEPERFKANPPISDDFIGTHEVVLILFPYELVDVEESVFLKKDGDVWRVTSFHERSVRNNHACVCDPYTDPPNYSAINFCKGYAPKCELFAMGIRPYPLYRKGINGEWVEIH